MPRGPKGEKRPTDEQQKAKALNRWENEGGATKAPTRRESVGQAHGRYRAGEVNEDPTRRKQSKQRKPKPSK